MSQNRSPPASFNCQPSAAGAASTPPPAGQDLETAHVVWCATGHAGDFVRVAPWRVATYAPHLYAGEDVPLIEL